MPEKPILVITRRLPEPVEARIMHDYDARFNASDASTYIRAQCQSRGSLIRLNQLSGTTSNYTNDPI